MKNKIKHILFVVLAILLLAVLICLAYNLYAIGKFILFFVFAALLGVTI